MANSKTFGNLFLLCEIGRYERSKMIILLLSVSAAGLLLSVRMADIPFDVYSLANRKLEMRVSCHSLDWHTE